MIKTEPNKILHKNIKTIKRSNKLIEALVLPRIININPRSVYNKVIEFHNFVKEESIDCIFMSESWEKPENPLDDIINLPSHMVISNPHQRKGIGGRPALFINQDKYHIRNLTQTLIDIPLGGRGSLGSHIPKKCHKQHKNQKNRIVQSLFQTKLQEENSPP